MRRRLACVTAATCLLDNTAVATRREADQAAAALDDSPDSEWVHTPGGYAFRLLPEVTR